MTTEGGETLTVAEIYAQSEDSLNEALKVYKKAVKRIVRPTAGEHYVTGRVKAKRSLIRKLSKDGDGSRRSWDQITDKVGIRVVCSTKRERDATAKALERYGWESCDREDKRPGEQQLQYSGIHLTVSDGRQRDAAGGAILCEIQVRTRAQDAWSVVSHKLTYKGVVALPSKFKRVVWRATVLTEIFDDDIQRMFKKRESLPAYDVARAVEYLDQEFETLLGEPGGEVQDLDIMNVLWNAYTPEERGRFTELIDEFLDTETDLRRVILDHQPGQGAYLDSHDWLYTQPEVLAVLERGKRNEHMLLHAVENTDLDQIVVRTCDAYGIVLSR